MKRKTTLFFVLALLMISESLAQKIATLKIELANPAVDIPVTTRVELDPITKLSDSEIDLVLVEKAKRTSVPFQVYTEGTRYLTWMIQSTDKKRRSFTFELIPSKKTSASFSTVASIKENGSLTFRADGKNLLRYQFEKLTPPSGIDPSYARSGFIHPLWSPKGQVLTRVQPPDHYHHYGIWNPWTHVLYEGDTIDFWNLNKKEGTVRFAKFISVNEGPVFGEFSALHEHVVFRKDGSEKVALNEIQSVRIFRPSNEAYFIVDVISELNCADSSPFKILEYRYAGLGWRATEKWDRHNSEVITSEGKSRKDADGSTAKWCIVQGAIDDAYAGAVMMSAPSNYNHPEPLRVWPENQYERGDVFANFSPTKNRDWLLEPGKTYTLKYRFVVFNGKFSKEQADVAWDHFANGVTVSVTK